jgi:hypothetical protein
MSSRRALAASLLAFADEIGATVVAEGIETNAELDTLRALGVPLGQGYLLAAPGPAPIPGRVAISDATPASGVAVPSMPGEASCLTAHSGNVSPQGPNRRPRWGTGSRCSRRARRGACMASDWSSR